MEFVTMFLDSLLAFILLYKYLGLFLIAFVAALLLPLPSSTALAAAGAFASQGYLDFTTVILVALAGNIGGDVTGYLLARRFGIPVLSRIGFRRLFATPQYASLARYIADFAPSLVFFTRFMTTVGPTVNILSGVTKVPKKTFFLYDALGETSYVLLYGGAGYALGTQWENNLAFLAEAGLVFALLGVVMILIRSGLSRRNSRTT